MTGRTNLDAQGRDNGWARDGSGKLVALNSSDDVLRVALASQPKQPADDGIRIYLGPSITLSTNCKWSPTGVPFRRRISSATRLRQSEWHA